MGTPVPILGQARIAALVLLVVCALAVGPLTTASARPAPALAQQGPCGAGACSSAPAGQGPCGVNSCPSVPADQGLCGAHPCVSAPVSQGPCGPNPCPTVPVAQGPCDVAPCALRPADQPGSTPSPITGTAGQGPCGAKPCAAVPGVQGACDGTPCGSEPAREPAGLSSVTTATIAGRATTTPGRATGPAAGNGSTPVAGGTASTDRDAAANDSQTALASPVISHTDNNAGARSNEVLSGATGLLICALAFQLFRRRRSPRNGA